MHRKIISHKSRRREIDSVMHKGNKRRSRRCWGAWADIVFLSRFLAAYVYRVYKFALVACTRSIPQRRFSDVCTSRSVLHELWNAWFKALVTLVSLPAFLILYFYRETTNIRSAYRLLRLLSRFHLTRATLHNIQSFFKSFDTEINSSWTNFRG